MKVLVLLVTLSGALDASKRQNRHDVEMEEFFSDGIDPAPDIVHGEANRLRAQEPLEGHSSVQKKLKATSKHRPAQNVSKVREGDFGRDKESSTRSSLGSKSGEDSRRDSVTASSVPQVVVYVKNPPKSPLRAQVIRELAPEKPLPTIPLTSTQGPAKPGDGSLAPPPPPPEPSVPSPGYPKAESQKAPDASPMKPSEPDHKRTSPVPPTASPAHSANGPDTSASEHEASQGTDSGDTEMSEEETDEEKTHAEGDGNLKEAGASPKTIAKGNPPSYPVTKEQFHSPSASKADRVVSSTVTVPPEAYQHPRGKTRSTVLPSPPSTSPVPPTSKSVPTATAPAEPYGESVPASHEDAAEKEVASEEHGGDEGYDVDHKISTVISSTQGGVEDRKGGKEESEEQIGGNQEYTGTNTEIETTVEPESPNEGENPYGSNVPASKEKKIKEDHTGHTSKQEEAEDAYDKSLAESEVADDSGENSEDTDKTSKQNEAKSEYEPENGEHQSEKAGPIPDQNEAEGEHEQAADVEEPAENSEYAPEEPYGPSDHGKVEEKEEPADSEHVPEKTGTTSDEKDKSADEEKEKPSAEAEPEEKTNHTSEKISPASNKKEAKSDNKKPTAVPKTTKSSSTASAKAGKENGHSDAKENYKESAEATEGSESVEEARESVENTEPSSEVTDGKASYDESEGNANADGEESQLEVEGNYGPAVEENHVDMAVHSSVPVVRVDSKTKDHDIVIAYSPTRTKKLPTKAGRGKKTKKTHVSKTKSSSGSHKSTKGARYINVPSMDSLPSDLLEQQENLPSSIVAIKRTESVETEWTDESPETSTKSSPVSPKKVSKHKKLPSGTKHNHLSSTPAAETETPQLDLHSTAPPSEEAPNLHKKSIYTDFPRPEDLPITIVLTKEEAKAPTPALPTPGKLPATKYPGNFPGPEIISIELPEAPVLSSLDGTEELASDNSTISSTQAKKLPHKSRPSASPKPKGITKSKPKKSSPKPKPSPNKKNLTNFPRPKKVAIKKEFSKYPRPRKLPIKKIFSTFPRPGNDEGIVTTNSTEPPVESSSMGTPEIGAVPIIEPSVDAEKDDELSGESDPVTIKKEATSSKSTTTFEGIPEKHVTVEEKTGERSFSEFPRPGYIGMIPSFLKLTGSGKVVTSSKFAVPTVKSPGEGGGVTIFLSSNFSTDETDSVPQLRPIFINVPHPQPLPLNVTITRRTVRKLRKSHKKHVKPQNDDSQTADIDEKQTQHGWKVTMVPKTFLKPVAETTPEAPFAEEPFVEAITDETIAETENEPLVGESIDEPALEKSQYVDETIAAPETTTAWEYVTAPGERTAAPEVLAAQVAQDSLLTSGDRFFGDNEVKPIERRRSPRNRHSLENLLNEIVLETTAEPEPEVVHPHRNEIPKTAVVIEVNLNQNWMQVPYYGDIYENTDETSLDLAYKGTEKSTTNPISHVRTKQSGLPFRSRDEPPRSDFVRRMTAHTVRSETSTKAPRTPHKTDCSTEVDEKGALCESWARGGLCHSHRPTMLLICRKTCLCGSGLSRY